MPTVRAATRRRTCGAHDDSQNGPTREQLRALVARPLGAVAPVELIRRLHGDHTPLPVDTAEALCLPSGATYAGAAFLLWWAREADGGPGVRSYRAAAFLLAELDDLIRDRLLDLGYHPPAASDALQARGLDVPGLLDLEEDDALERHGAFARQ